MDREADSGRERGTERAEQALWAWNARDHDGPQTMRTRRGQEVIMERVEMRHDPASGVAYLDVYLGGEPEGGQAHFRVVNPPTLVQDPEGTVEVRGVRFRVDPLAALAEAVADNGGAQARKRRHGR